MKRFLFLLLLLLVFGSMAFALTNPTKFVWTPPTTNMDGTPLTDLGGYKIYCGQSTGNYSVVKDIGLPLLPEYPISGVLTKDGTYYCTITAYDTSGNESGKSNEINFPLDLTAPAAPGGFSVK